MLPTTRKPSHPGRFIREDYMKPLGVTVTDLAAHLGVSRKHMSNILNEKASVSSDIALRLSRAFNTSPDLWLNLQRACDLWEARQTEGWSRVEPMPGMQGMGEVK